MPHSMSKLNEILSNPNNFASIQQLRSTVNSLESFSRQGSGKSCFALALIYSPNNSFISEELKQLLPVSEEKELELVRQAFGLLSNEAVGGDGEAMHLLAIYYQTGFPPASCDLRKALDWNEKAFSAGYIFAASDLYAIYSNQNSEFFNPIKAQRYLEDLTNINSRQ